jgi:hypothetical protein
VPLARNDELFGRKKTKPHQISMHAKALIKDLEVLSQQHNLQIAKPTHQVHYAELENAVQTVRTDFYFTGPKLYVDAAW